MKSVPRIARLAIGVCALWPVLTGCIEFEQQKLSYHHDRATDTLRIHQTYAGISAGDRAEENGGPALSRTEKEQLLSVWTTERTFFFTNWIFELSLPQLRKNLAAPVPADASAEERAAHERAVDLMQLLLAHTRINNGPFYLDERHQLCGVQRVTLTNVTALVAAGNQALRAALAAEAAKREANDARRRVDARAAVDPTPFIAIEGNRVTVRIPATRDEYEKEIHQSDGTPTAMVQAFERSGGTIVHADGMVTIAFGRADSAGESFTGPGDSERYSPVAVPFVRDNFGLAEKFDPAADAERFFAPPPDTGP